MLLAVPLGHVQLLGRLAEAQLVLGDPAMSELQLFQWYLEIKSSVYVFGCVVVQYLPRRSVPRVPLQIVLGNGRLFACPEEKRPFTQFLNCYALDHHK